LSGLEFDFENDVKNCECIVLKAKAKAWTFETKVNTNDRGPKAKTNTIKVWPRGALKPRRGLEDYITAEVHNLNFCACSVHACRLKNGKW